MQDLTPLLTELRTNNAIQKELLKEKKIDDTPKQLLMGNMFEIFAQYDIFRKRQEQGQTIGLEVDENNKNSLSNNITETLLGNKKDGALKHISIILEEIFNITTKYNYLTSQYQHSMLELSVEGKRVIPAFTKIALLIRKNAIDSFERISLSSQNAFQRMVDTNEAVVKDAKNIQKDTLDAFKTLTEEEGPIPITAPYKDVPMGQGNVPKSAEEEKEKDNRTFLQKTIGVIANPISSLGTGIKKLGETFTIGNAALVTVLTLIVSGLIAFFPAFTGFAKGLIDMVGAIFTGDGEAFGKAVGDNLGGLFLLGLFLARKAIAGKFMSAIFTPMILPALKIFYAKAIGSTLAKAAVAFLKFNPIGLIIGILLSFFTLFGEKIYDYFNRKGLSGFVADIMTVLFDLVKGAIKGIGSLLGFGGGAENKFMGGTVAAGSPYIVGERGPELFVPGASGSIVPNGAMGGAPVIVNNNSVNQSSNTANHQHSNVSITDSQQEITGL